MLSPTTYQCLETKNKKQIRALPKATPKLSSEDYGTCGNRKISRVPHTKNSFSARHSPTREAEPEYVPRLTFWICLSNEMLQMCSIPTICTSQMPLTNPHWFSWSKNYCQLTFSDMFLTSVNSWSATHIALASKSSATRCRARCTSRWAKRCEKAVAPGSTDAASQCRFILQSPRCRIASHVPKWWLHRYHLWYWQSLRKSSCPNLATKSAQNQWQVAPSVEDPESKLGTETNRKRIQANIQLMNSKNIYRYDGHTKIFEWIKCIQMFLLPGKFDWDILCTLTTNCFTAPARSWWWAQSVQTAQPEVSMGTVWLLGHVIARLVWR